MLNYSLLVYEIGKRRARPVKRSLRKTQLVLHHKLLRHKITDATFWSNRTSLATKNRRKERSYWVDSRSVAESAYRVLQRHHHDRWWQKKTTSQIERDRMDHKYPRTEPGENLERIPARDSTRQKCNFTSKADKRHPPKMKKQQKAWKHPNQ